MWWIEKQLGEPQTPCIVLSKTLSCLEVLFLWKCYSDLRAEVCSLSALCLTVHC